MNFEERATALALMLNRLRRSCVSSGVADVEFERTDQLVESLLFEPSPAVVARADVEALRLERLLRSFTPGD